MREGEWKLMEKRHEDYYRLISSETDDDRKLEGERGEREREREREELEERRKVSPAVAASSLQPPSLTHSVP